MKSGNSFFKFGRAVFCAVVCFFGFACAAAKKQPAPETAFSILTESYAGYGKEVNQNPSRLARLFALPADFYAWETAEPPKRSAAEAPEKGWLGIGMKVPEDADDSGSAATAIEVGTVFPYSPAKAAGLLEGDKITGVDGRKWSAEDKDSLLKDFKQSVEDAGAGNRIRFTILRDGVSREIAATLKAKPRAAVKVKPGKHRFAYPDSLLHYALKKEKLEEEYMRTAAAIRGTTADVVSFLIKDKGSYNPFRLQAVNRAMYHPLELPAAAHDMSENLFESFNEETRDLPGLLRTGMAALDLKAGLTHPAAAPKAAGLGEYVERLVAAVSRAGQMRNDALAGLDAGDIDILYEGAADILKEDVEEEKKEEKTEAEKRQDEEDLLLFFKTALRPDLPRLLAAAVHVARAIDLTSLPDLPLNEGSAHRFKKDWVVREDPNLTILETPAGKVLIGGPGNNVYREDAAIILDVGGDDRYLGRAAGSSRDYPFALVIDFAGNDVYASSGDFVQGAGILGAGLLIDLQGDDLYSAGNYSQGMGFLGAGLLADLAGHDVYKSDAVSQGAGVFGVGILAEGGGNDDYSATRFSQAFGFVKGYGAIVEAAGADKYFAGGKYPDFRDPEKSYESLSQGFGFGLRPGETSAGASGGIGILADAAGNDTYIGDYFAQGASYWFALGILADRKGHDKYIAGRYSQGAGIHLSAGILLDGGGDDQYLASFGVSQGCGHDYAVGILLDNGGNDRYIGGVISQGAGNANGIGVLDDNGGDDEYYIKGLGQGRGNFLAERGLGSFGLHFDTGGGNDYYSPGGKNNHLIFKTRWGIFADTQ